MNLLSSILPGVRQIRTPFTVGALWAAVIVVAVLPLWDYIKGSEAIVRLDRFSQLFSESAFAAVGLFGIYLLGILMHGAAQGVMSSRQVKQRLKALEKQYVRILSRFARAIARPSLSATALVESTIRERLAKMADAVIGLVPKELVLDEFELAALKLSKESPEQFQEYDRVRSEGEFRTGVALPLLVLGCTLGSLLSWWLGIILVVVSILAASGLAAQGVGQSHKADELLASAIYFGFSSTPLLDNLANALEQVPEGDGLEDVRHLALLLNFLSDRGLLFKYGSVLSKMRHPSRRTTQMGDELLGQAEPYLKFATRSALKRFFPAEDDTPTSTPDAASDEHGQQT